MAERMRTHRGMKYVVSAAHPAAEAFPWLDEDELQALADDIAANGQEYKVLRLPDGRVVDGRNRELACRVAGVEPQYAEDPLTDGEAIALVISRNLHRRSLSVSQRAMIAAELTNMRQGGRATQTGNVAGLKSQEKTAETFDVSERTVRSAVKVKNDAPELVGPVKDGKLDVHTAARVADLPKPERKKIAKAKDPKKAAKAALDGVQATPLAVHQSPDEAAPATVDSGAEFVAGVEAICRDADQLAARMKALKASPFSHSIHIDSAVSQVEAARKALWQGRPAHVCPYCKTEPAPACKACKGTGRVKKTTFDSGRAAVGEAA